MLIQRLVLCLLCLLLSIESAKSANIASEMFGRKVPTYAQRFCPAKQIWDSTCVQLGMGAHRVPLRNIHVVETARDNWQNVQFLDGKPLTFPPESRLDYIRRIRECRNPGSRLKIDTGSFVSLKAVPQMERSDEVLIGLPADSPADSRTTYSFIIPNERGLDDLLRARDKRKYPLKPEVAVIVSASEAFSMANIGVSVSEGVNRALGIVRAADYYGFLTRAYISMAFGDPRDVVKPGITRQIARDFKAVDCDEIVLCDTAFFANPRIIHETCTDVASVVPAEKLALHLHVNKEWIRGWMNVSAGLLAGIRTFDAGNLRVDPFRAVIKGCPYSPEAPQNIITADLLEFFEDLDMSTNWDSAKVRALYDEGLSLP